MPPTDTGTSAGSGVVLSFYTDVAEAVGSGASDVLGAPLSNLADSTTGLALIGSVIFATSAGIFSLRAGTTIASRCWGRSCRRRRKRV